MHNPDWPEQFFHKLDFRNVTVTKVDMSTNETIDSEDAFDPSKGPLHDRFAYMDLVRDQLKILEGVGEGEDLRPGLEETPQRVAKMWMDELTSGTNVDIEGLFKKFRDHGDYEGMVLVTDVPVMSQCEHHLVPFVGYAHIAYFPGTYVVGLSKIPRVVEAFSRRLQIQERLTQQIHDSMVKYLEPRGVIVVLECEHLCMTLRGIQRPGTKTLTSAVSGLFRDPGERARDEFYSLVQNRKS